MSARKGMPHSLNLLMVDEALQASACLIEKAYVLESGARWRRLSSKTYRQIEETRAALRRLDDALDMLDRRLTGIRRVIK